jgi:tetratricopeptide (TPR) repeat protein
MNKKDLAWENIMKSIDRNYVWKSPAEINFAVGLGEGLKKYRDMLRLYIPAISQWPTADLYVGLARTYERMGEKDRAAEALTKALAMDPNVKH